MVKLNSNFPVRGVPGGWRDEWSAPDDAAIVRAQFATWAARAEKIAAPSNGAKAAAPAAAAPPASIATFWSASASRRTIPRSTAPSSSGPPAMPPRAAGRRTLASKIATTRSTTGSR